MGRNQGNWSQGVKWLKIIYLFKKRLLGSGQHQEECEDRIWIQCFRRLSFGHAHQQAQEPFKTQMPPNEGGKHHKSPSGRDGKLGSVLSLMPRVQPPAIHVCRLPHMHRAWTPLWILACVPFICFWPQIAEDATPLSPLGACCLETPLPKVYFLSSNR